MNARSCSASGPLATEKVRRACTGVADGSETKRVGTDKALHLPALGLKDVDQHKRSHVSSLMDGWIPSVKVFKISTKINV